MLCSQEAHPITAACYCDTRRKLAVDVARGYIKALCHDEIAAAAAASNGTDGMAHRLVEDRFLR